MSKPMHSKKEINIEIGNRIRIARETAGYTQEKLANYIGIGPQAMSDIERGKYCASVPNLIKICECLHISGDYILMGREPESMTQKHYLVQGVQYLDQNEKEFLDRLIQLFFEIISRTKKS